jgi:tetrahydromethanopterin S-methyltransferase subunit B
VKKHPERLFLLAAVIGFVFGKLIKNFKWGLLIGLLVAAIVAFIPPIKKKSQ